MFFELMLVIGITAIRTKNAHGNNGAVNIIDLSTLILDVN